MLLKVIKNHLKTIMSNRIQLLRRTMLVEGIAPLRYKDWLVVEQQETQWHNEAHEERLR